MERASTQVVQDTLAECVARNLCPHGCFHNYFRSAPGHTAPPGSKCIRELATRIADWREDLAGSKSRAGTLLTHLNDSWTHGATGEHAVLKSSQVRCYIPLTDCQCCLSCWALAADVGYMEPGTGSIRRGAMFARVLAAFNRGALDASNVYPAQAERKESCEQLSICGAIHQWLEQWLPGNVDQASMDPGTLILDAPSRRFVYDQMSAEWIVLHRQVPHYSVFIRTMRKHYRIVINKHKKFAQCQVCALYKELWSKSRMESYALRHEIKEMRRAHLDQQYSQRQCYYCNRELSFSNPDKYLCLIVDAMTEGSTSAPFTRRDVKQFKPAAYKTQLYGALVHGPEGFFGYTTCSMKGARVTVEVVHRTLLKLAETRKVWPSVFNLQLDNTTSDCKNHTVMAYRAWLEATGVFEVTTVSFLQVGHTHEDIDGMFGLLRRHFFRLGKAVITIPELHGHIRDCFHKDTNKWLEEDLDKSAIDTDIMRKHFDYGKLAQTTFVEHVWSTYDWTRFLLQEHHPDGRAFGEIANIAQLQDPDVYRPHLFEFTIDGGVVVLNVKHWANDRKYWNETPQPVWRRVPQLHDLRPAPVDLTKPLQELYRGLRWCNEWHEKTGLRCKQKGPEGGCPRCNSGHCSCVKCKRCEQADIVQQYLDFKAAVDISEVDLETWGAHFDALNQTASDASLRPLTAMQLPRCARLAEELPSIQAQIDALPRMMKQAPKGLKCKLAVCGLGPKGFRNMMADVDVSVPQGRNGARESTLSIQRVVAGLRSPKGVLEFAVLQPDGTGTWVTFQELRNFESARETACGEQVRSRWFGADVDFNEVFVQESSKRMYRAHMAEHVFDREEWILDFPKQQEDPVFGISACPAERQMIDLEELSFRVLTLPPPTAAAGEYTTSCTRWAVAVTGEMALITTPGCHVWIESLRVLNPPVRHHHRFWVSRNHFGLEFIHKKLRPHMLTVQGQATNLFELQR